MSVLFENRRQARKARLLLILMAVWWIGWTYWAYEMGRSFGLSPGDGGALRPPAARLAVAGLLGLIGIAPFAGMVVYSRIYLTKIERLRDEVCLTVLGVLWPQTCRFPPSAFGGGAGEYEGKMRGRITVDAPWMTLRVRGRVLPFVVDMQAEYVNHSAIRALANRRPDEPEQS